MKNHEIELSRDDLKQVITGYADDVRRLRKQIAYLEMVSGLLELELSKSSLSDVGGCHGCE